MTSPIILPSSQPLVLFDADCLLCRNFAHWGERRAGKALQFQGWQTFLATEAATHLAETMGNLHELPPDKLRVIDSGQIFSGPAAWQRLLELHPDFKGLHWLAERLGLTAPTARALEKAGAWAQRLCLTCGR